jgi:hypothetical protein
MFGIQVKESCPVGPRYKYVVPWTGVVMHYWAEGGMVCVEDQTTGEYSVWTQAEARNHFKVIGTSLLKMDIFSVDDAYFRDLKTDYGRLAHSFHQVLQDARAQGDPMEDVVVQRKERAELGSRLMDYQNQFQIVHQGGADVKPVPADPRARMLPNGMLHLPHGLGKKFERKTFTL